MWQILTHTFDSAGALIERTDRLQLTSGFLIRTIVKPESVQGGGGWSVAIVFVGGSASSGSTNADLANA
jgi:hypothetical protein